MTTLGSKLRTARTAAGLTQEELASKLYVSRQAVTKWEADKGVPDIANLRAAAQLFGVSIDYLVADESTSVATATREPVGEWSSYKKKGKARNRYDAVVQAFYPRAERIRPVVRRRKITRWRWLMDLATNNNIGTIEFIWNLPGLKAFYLVDLGTRQLLVSLDRKFIECRELTAPVTGRKFQIGTDTYHFGWYSF